MASLFYDGYKDDTAAFLTGNVKAVLVDTADYTYSSAHDFLDDIPGAARVATSANLASKTLVNGALGSGNATFSAVTGDVSEAIVFYIDTGVETTSTLIAYRDSDNGTTGLPVTPNGGDITVDLSNGIGQL